MPGPAFVPRNAALACAVALLAATFGCAADTQRQTSPPVSLITASVSPKTIVAERRWLLASLAIENPDGLAAIDGAVFVKTDDGRVARVDPRTNTVVARAKLDTARDPAHYCQGIGSDGRTLWACSASDTSTDLVELDPRSLAVTSRAAVDKVFDQYSLPVVGGKVWALAGDGHLLTSVDTATGRTSTVPLPHRCFQLAATSRIVYATCILDDQTIAVDSRTGKIIGHVHVSGPTNVAASGKYVWVSGSGGLLRLDRKLVPQVLYPSLSAGPEGDLLATKTAIWVRNPSSFLVRIDPARRVSARYALGSALSGGSLLVAEGSLWTSASDDSTVLRVALRKR